MPEWMVESSQLSDVGQKRKHNEDYVGFYEPHRIADLSTHGRLYVLADGVGGATAGDVASQYTVNKVIYAYYQQHIDDNDELGLYILCEGGTASSPHNYQVEIIFPAVAIIDAPISVDGKRLAEAGDLRVLEDSTFGSVIVRVKNLQSSYAA